MPSPLIRTMTQGELPEVMALQSQCYPPSTIEDEASFQARLHAAPEHAWVAQVGEELGAYLLSYPSRLGHLTPLNGHFKVARPADCLYLHDLAVAPSRSGQGLARLLLAHAWAHATGQGLRRSSLVSVQGSRPFWERQGFAVAPPASALHEAHLATYEGPACYMVKAW